MILQTIASLVILAVTAAPGRVFERRVDERAPRQFRSTFAEYVELIIIGATTTLFAVIAVVLVGGLLGGLDLGDLLNHPRDYVKEEPWRVAIGAVAAIVLSFVIADVVPRWRYPRSKSKDKSAYRQHTIWYDAFEKERPADKSVSVSIELQDGLRLSGVLVGFSPTEGDDRELMLRPVVMLRPGLKAVALPKDQFLLLRESQVRFLLGEYAPLAKQQEA
ncbi:MAG TPA: DUF6338 family protein [Solirubrobacterales bacterium]|nr:DUF6338 family protein [Solirubrobacterales bacterium]